MLRIDCPHCGMRDYTEFAYGGDATRHRPDTAGEVSDDAWDAYVYLRANPRGQHTEYWHHVLGCHRWLKIIRDTVTDVVSDVHFAREEVG